MYKLISLVFLVLVILAGSAKSLDLSIYKDGYYLRYEFPRFSEQTWFEVELGKKPGFSGFVSGLTSKASR